MGKLLVRIVEPHEYDTWDEFVGRSPQGTLFHTSVWKRVIDSSSEAGHLKLIGCFDDFGLLGGCVLFERERFGHLTGVTPLLTPYVGILLDIDVGEKLSDRISRDTEVLDHLIRHLLDNYEYVNLINPPHLEDVRPLVQAGFQLVPRFTYYLNLRLPAEEHWARFDGSARRQIKKAQRENFDLLAHVHPAEGYELLTRTYARRGENCPVSKELFEAVVGHEGLREYREIIAAYLNNQLIAYIVLLKFRQTLYYGIAATHSDYLSTGVSSLLIWEILQQYGNREWREFDFVGANIPSIARFKENFNPRLQMYFQMEYFGHAYLRLGKTLLERLRST